MIMSKVISDNVIFALTRFIDEFESMRKELKVVSDIVASQDKRIEQLEMLVHNG